jgi:hypothetical protein
MKKGKQRPDLVDKRPVEALFHSAGPTGWQGRRDIHNHKGNMKEGDFSHLHSKFWSEGDDPVE